MLYNQVMNTVTLSRPKVTRLWTCLQCAHEVVVNVATVCPWCRADLEAQMRAEPTIECREVVNGPCIGCGAENAGPGLCGDCYAEVDYPDASEAA